MKYFNSIQAEFLKYAKKKVVSKKPVKKVVKKNVPTKKMPTKKVLTKKLEQAKKKVNAPVKKIVPTKKSPVKSGSFLDDFGDKEVRNPDSKSKKPMIKIKSLKSYEKNTPQHRLYDQLYRAWQKKTLKHGQNTKLRSKKEEALYNRIDQQREKMKGKETSYLDKIKQQKQLIQEQRQKLKDQIKSQKEQKIKSEEKKQPEQQIQKDPVIDKKQELQVAGDEKNQYQQTISKINNNKDKLKNDISFLADPPPPSQANIDEIKQSADSVQRALEASGVKGSNISKIVNSPNTVTYKIGFDNDVNKLNGVGFLLSEKANRVISSMVGKQQDVIISEDRSTGTVNIEVPKDHRDTVYLKDLLTDDNYLKEVNNPKKFVVPLGKDANGKVITFNFNENPHLLLAGGTGSGKSVCANSMMNSLMASYSSDEVKFSIIDVAKEGNEFRQYKDSKYLATPIAATEKDAIKNIEGVYAEAQKNKRKLAELSDKTGRSFEDINKWNAFIKKNPNEMSSEEKQAFDKLSPEEKKPMPHIMLFADEVKTLLNPGATKNAMLIRKKLDAVLSVARQGGANVIIATQSPSLRSIPRDLQANLGSKVVLKLNTKADADTVDEPNATRLLGNGDAFIVNDNISERVQTGFVSRDESTVFGKNTAGEQSLIETKPSNSETSPNSVSGSTDTTTEFQKNVDAIKQNLQKQRQHIQEMTDKMDKEQDEQNEWETKQQEEASKIKEQRRQLERGEPLMTNSEHENAFGTDDYPENYLEEDDSPEFSTDTTIPQDESNEKSESSLDDEIEALTAPKSREEIEQSMKNKPQPKLPSLSPKEEKKRTSLLDRIKSLLKKNK